MGLQVVLAGVVVKLWRARLKLLVVIWELALIRQERAQEQAQVASVAPVQARNEQIAVIPRLVPVLELELELELRQVLVYCGPVEEEERARTSRQNSWETGQNGDSPPHRCILPHTSRHPPLLLR